MKKRLLAFAMTVVFAVTGIVPAFAVEQTDENAEQKHQLSSDVSVPADALVYNGHAYYVYSNSSSWEDAVAFCESKGGYMAAITSQDENDTVYKYIRDQGYENAYFGLTDEGHEGTWTWINGEKSAYRNWASGEPNNSGDENYAMFYYKFTDGTWNDGNFGEGTQNDSKTFLCEWDFAEGINVGDQSIVVGETNDLTIGVCMKDGSANKLAQKAEVSVENTTIASASRVNGITKLPDSKIAFFTVRVTGKEIGSTKLTVKCSDDVTKTITLNVVDKPSVDIHAQANTAMEQAGISEDCIIPDDIKLSLGDIKGPVIQLGKKEFNLFELSGSVELGFGEANFQTLVDGTDKTIKIMAGMKQAENASIEPDGKKTGNTDQWKKSYDQVKSMYQDVTGKKVDTTRLWNKYQTLRKNLKKTKSTMVIGVDGQLALYAEFSYASGEPELLECGATLAVSANGSVDCHVHPPVYITFGAKVGADGSIALTPNLDAKTVAALMKITPAFTANIGIGVGEKKAKTYVEGGFQGTMEAPIQVSTNSSQNSVEVNLKGSLYWKTEVLGIFKKTGTMDLGDPVQIYSSNEKSKARNTLQDITVGENELVPEPRTRAAQSAIRQERESGIDELWIENTFGHSSPQMVMLENGNRVLMWLGENSEKADDDRTTLYYCVYDVEAGAWGDIEPALENNAYNGVPQLCVNGNTVFLVWQRASQTLGTSGDLDAVSACLDLWYSELRDGSFTTPVCISEQDNGLAKAEYTVATDGSTTAVAWLENSANDLLYTEGTNVLYVRSCSEGTWQTIEQIVSTTDIISDVDLSVTDGTVSVTYQLSDDTGAVSLYVDNGQTKTIEENAPVTKSMWFGGKLYYLKDSVLYVYDGTSSTQTNLTDLSNFDLTTNGTQTCLTTIVSDGECGEIYRSDYNATQDIWSPLVQISDYHTYIRSYSAVMESTGSLELANNLVELTDSDEDRYGDASLRVTGQTEYFDLSVEEDLYYDTENVVPGQELPLTLTVHNNSNEAVSSLTAEILDADGNVLQTNQVDVSIPSGESAEVSTSYTLPEDLNRQIIAVRISDEHAEAVEDNNSASAELGYGDLAVENLEATMQEGVPVLKGNLVNRGYETVENIALNISDPNAEETELDTLTLSTALETGESCEFAYYLPEQYWSLLNDSMMYEICVQATTDTQESRSDNNDARTVFGDLQQTVDVPELSIITQPEDYSGIVGETASFTVDATGKNFTCQWQVNTTGEWKNSTMTGNDTCTLSVPIAAKRDGQKYRVILTDGDGNTVTSEEATLHVQPDPITIKTQPADYTGAVGGTATFTVEAEGENLSYQWQYQNAGSNSWQKSSQSGNQTDTVSVPITAKRDGQKYRVVITDGDGNTLTSNAATLHVEEAAITIKTQPVDYTGAVGGTATFTVEAEGENLSYQWQYQNAGSNSWQKSSQTGNQTDTVCVPITAKRDGQKYRVVITDGDGNTLTSNAATLHVEEAAITIKTQPVDYTGAVGDTATFTVEAEGENLSYQWQYQNAGSNSWQKSSQTGNQTDMVSVPITAKRDGQKYRVVITDGDGNTLTSNAATLHVEEAAITIKTQPVDYTGAVGDTATFTVEAEGENLSYQWQYQNAGSNSWQKSSQTGNQTDTVCVPITAKRDGQKYRVVITDGDGNTLTSNAATLHVEAAAITIKTQPADYTGAVGGTATFTVEAEGENLSYQWQYQNAGSNSWQKSSQSGNQTDMVSVPITAKRDGQKYRVVITDGDGNTLTSNAATLIVS